MEVGELSIAEYEVQEQTDASGEPVFVIRVIHNNRFIRLNKKFYSLLMELQNSESLTDSDNEDAIQFVDFLKMVELFRDDDRPVAHLEDKIEKRLSLWNRIVNGVLHSTVSIKNSDKIIEYVYLHFGQYILSRIGICSIGTLLITGSTAFIGSFLFKTLAPVELPSIPAIVATLWVGALFSILIHEMAHALTCKHFGCKIAAFGVMFYYGLPGAFVDTSDAYFLTKWKRVIIDLAGIAANLLIIAACGICLLFVEGDYFVILRLIAFVNIFLVLWNLIPFLKYDGYFALADALDYPNLRTDAISRVLHINSFKSTLPTSGRDFALLLFGLGSILFTVILLVLVALYIRAILTRLIPEPYNTAFPTIVAFVAFSFLFQRAIKKMKNMK